MMLTVSVLPPPPFLWKRQWWLVPLWSDHYFYLQPYLYGRFANFSVASSTSQFILQPFFRFSYVTGSSLTSPGEPPVEICIVRMKIKLVVTPQWNKPPLSLSQKWRKGSTNAVNIIIEREGKHIFCLSSKFCLKLFLIDCNGLKKSKICARWVPRCLQAETPGQCNFAERKVRRWKSNIRASNWRYWCFSSQV